MAKASFGTLVKVVVDIEKEILVVDSELHADEEAYLLSQGSHQEHLWGINLYPDLPESEWIEFDSMINLRPASGNISRGVNNPAIREKIVFIVNKRIKR
ncbi:hypothetical protein HYW55_00795 [Candidatus Gottesmanbacteria bacterium]|nr:hypothetical protein [Candidatus Gottesmanbacteria bacterium]